MRRLWLTGCQVRACLSAPWSLGKVNVPLNQTSGRPSPLSAGRCCSLPAEFKVHSHLLPETYPEPQNGGRYALIKLSWSGFDSRWWWGPAMKRLYALKMSPFQLHGIVHVSDARGGFLFIDFHKIYFIYRCHCTLKMILIIQLETVKHMRFGRCRLYSSSRLFWNLERKFLLWIQFLFGWRSIWLLFFFSQPGIKAYSIKELFLNMFF